MLRLTRFAGYNNGRQTGLKYYVLKYVCKQRTINANGCFNSKNSA